MPVTLKQLALHSGLSVPTISQVLNDKGHRYSAETCRRVMKAVEELGYRPNSSARAIRTGRFNCAALVLSTDTYRSFLPPPLLRGFHDGLAEKDMHLTVVMLPDEKLNSQGFVPKLLRQWMADGLLINVHVKAPEGMKELIERFSIPGVWINSPQPADCVWPDDRQGARLLTERLLDAGHTRIAYADSGYAQDAPPHHFSAAERLGGYTDAMAAAGRSALVFRPSTALEPGERAAFAEDALRVKEPPTAVVCYADTVALTFLQAATALGLRVPRDLTIACCSEGRVSHSGIELPAAVIPWADVGRSATVLLREKIENPGLSASPRRVPYAEISGELHPPRGK